RTACSRCGWATECASRPVGSRSWCSACCRPARPRRSSAAALLAAWIEVERIADLRLHSARRSGELPGLHLARDALAHVGGVERAFLRRVLDVLHHAARAQDEAHHDVALEVGAPGLGLVVAGAHLLTSF